MHMLLGEYGKKNKTILFTSSGRTVRISNIMGSVSTVVLSLKKKFNANMQMRKLKRGEKKINGAVIQGST